MDDLFIVADIIGIIAFSVSGFLVALRHNLDLLGIAISSTLTALGGGIVRDTILGRTPFAFESMYPAMTLLVTLGILALFKLFWKEGIEKHSLFVISDTIGLVAFSITGALLGIGADYNFFGVVALSFITAIGGGVIRDVLINQVPSVLISDFYGSISLIVAMMLYGLHVSFEITNFSLLLVALFAITLRLVAYYRKWQLPKLAP
jgi:uncharacterized membrane protein YeiH